MIALGLLLAATSGCESATESATAPQRAAPIAALPVAQKSVRTVFDQRCVVCHSCYDAPCQLNLGSDRGLARGASKHPVYDARRLLPQEPTRLGIDAHGAAAWRELGFHEVTQAERGPSAGLVSRMLALGRSAGFEPGARLPEGFPLDINRELACPTSEEFARYAESTPQGGMPYGLAPLAEDEFALLTEWLAQGAPALSRDVTPNEDVSRQKAAWERFLNGKSLKERISARYVYEHWFVTHLHFRSAPSGPFFRAVRSSTPPGEAIREIATRRPYDSPGEGPFWYRLAPIVESIVHKTHVVYPLDDERLSDLKASFLDSDWQPTKLPEYGYEKGSNPFVTFLEVPSRSRYRFLLDDARHFISTFIRGPVCHGQVAVDVIEDQFWIAFLDPDHDLSVADPRYLREAAELLDLPAEHGSLALPGGLWADHAAHQVRYLDLRRKAYSATDPSKLGPSLDYVWDGGGSDRDALLTVFRHFDNATVVRGLVGAVPENAWIIDYPIFERIYYNLVAGFDVFGNVAHQAATRLYMDHLRMQSENLLLAFLPEAERKRLRDSWYQGATDEVHQRFINRPQSEGHGTQVVFEGDDYVGELFRQLRDRNPDVAGPEDSLNRCDSPPCRRRDATPLEQRAEAELQRIAGQVGPWVQHLPEVSWLRVHADDDPGTGHAYSLTNDRAHTNVASMFGEEDRLQPELDRVTVIDGTLGSYPNFFFDVPVDRIRDFRESLMLVREPRDLESLVDRFGVRRTDPRFWALLDWYQADHARRAPTEAGIIDLGRYQNL